MPAERPVTTPVPYWEGWLNHIPADQCKVRTKNMCHLKLPALFLALSLVVRCVTAAPNNWYSVSSSEQTNPRPEGWIPPGFSTNPFLKFVNPLSEGGLTAVNRHHTEKRRCNTATCVTQRLADFLIRSSNTIGTVYAPTNVGSDTYGKRDLLEPFGNQGL